MYELLVNILTAARAVFDYSTIQVFAAVWTIVKHKTKYDRAEHNDNANDTYRGDVGKSANERSHASKSQSDQINSMNF